MAAMGGVSPVASTDLLLANREDGSRAGSLEARIGGLMRVSPRWKDKAQFEFFKAKARRLCVSGTRIALT